VSSAAWIRPERDRHPHDAAALSHCQPVGRIRYYKAAAEHGCKHLSSLGREICVDKLLVAAFEDDFEVLGLKSVAPAAVAGTRGTGRGIDVAAGGSPWDDIDCMHQTG